MPLDIPGGGGVHHLNDSGDMVGGTGQHGLVYHAGIVTLFDAPGATGTYALGINSVGSVVGGYVDATPAVHGFLYHGGSVVTIDAPGADGTTAMGINTAGQIVGTTGHLAGEFNGFLDDAGVFTAISYPGAVDTEPSDINDSGQIAGTYVLPFSHYSAFLREKSGAFLSFDGPGVTDTHAYGLNNLGVVVGTADRHGFVYHNGTFNFIDFPGAFATSVSSINDRGQILGYYSDSYLGPYHEFLGQPVPEPAPTLLVGALLAGIVFTGRIRRCVLRKTCAVRGLRTPLRKRKAEVSGPPARRRCVVDQTAIV
jgi:uncharacterized membrane protein